MPDSNLATCLFTGAELSENTKIEHVILRALGGRLTSKKVTSSEFNEKSSSFDKILGDKYKLIFQTLAPLLPSEANPGAMITYPEDGMQLTFENGVVSLKGIHVLKRYPSGKPEVIYLPDDDELIKRIVKNKSFALRLDKAKKKSLPGNNHYFEGIPICNPHSEISILKCALCSFDMICQEHCPELNFIRDNTLHEVKNFVKESIYSTAPLVNIPLLDKYYLGIQIDKEQSINQSLKSFKYDRGSYEHIMLITTNSATHTIDILWDILGIDVHGIRLTTNWNGPMFSGLIANPILKGKSFSHIINVGIENPYIHLSKTEYKSFAWESRHANPSAAISFLSERFKQAYYDAVIFRENNADEFLIKQFSRSARWEEATDYTVIDFIKKRLIRFYKECYRYEDFDNLIEKQLDPLKSVWGSIPFKEMPNLNVEQQKNLLNDYRAAFNALHAPFHCPGNIFVKKN